jgi:hypothetical protein
MSDEGFLESLDRRMEDGFKELRTITSELRGHFDAKLEVLQTHAVSTDHNTAGIESHLRELNGQVAKNAARIAFIEEETVAEKALRETMASYRAGQMAFKEKWRYRAKAVWKAVTGATGRAITLGLLAALGVSTAVERLMEYWQ